MLETVYIYSSRSTRVKTCAPLVSSSIFHFFQQENNEFNTIIMTQSDEWEIPSHQNYGNILQEV